MKKQISTVAASSLNMWLVFRLVIDGFNASLCQTSWVTTLGCPSGCFEYIEIMVKDGNGGPYSGRRLIVDTNFKSQFELARPTQAYRELSSTLPLIFVGQEDKLVKIVSLLCSAAKESLKQQGLHIPPWRTTAYMQSKWLSQRCHKVPNSSATNASIDEPQPLVVANGDRSQKEWFGWGWLSLVQSVLQRELLLKWSGV